MKMLSIICKAVIVSSLILVTGCSEINVCYSDHQGDDNTQPDANAKALITFHASVEGRNMLTRAMSPLSKNINVQMFAYVNYDVPAPRLVVSGEYVSLIPGTLSGVDNYKMYLVNGTYDFYGFSENNSTTPVSFENDMSMSLQNNIDYLWWAGLRHDVVSSQLLVPIVFNHCATQVSFDVTNGNGIQKSKLVSATIIPSKPGAKLNLKTGVIPYATEYDSMGAAMGVAGSVAQFTMLPLQTSVPMTVTFDVIVNDDVVARTYAVDVFVPNGVLAPGNSYRFKLVLDGSEISFDSVNVRSWVDVDETGKPLYPHEQ